MVIQLLENALKFTSHGSIKLSIDVSNGKDNVSFLTFKVIDTGMGIPPDKLQSIFEGFYQMDGSFSRRHGGLGIGLSLCKAISEKMGGSLEIDSLEKEGTTATLRIPITITNIKISSQKTSHSNNVTGLLPNSPKILIVEDNVVNQMTIMAMVKKMGARADKADNGKVALELMSEGIYDAVLMDCQMPVLDGFEASKQIRQLDNANQHIPIIAVTANTMSGDRQLCLDSGMNDYIRKPVKKHVIYERLEHWLSASKNETEENSTSL